MSGHNDSNIGLGGLANNLLAPVHLFSDFIYTGCFVIGIAFIFASILKYVDHCRSPLMVPLSTVLFLFFAGIALILIPIVSQVSGYGLSYSLFK